VLFEKFYDASAGGYEQAFGRVSRDLVPSLLRAAHVSAGQRVLDVATGTGIVAAAALDAVGPSGHVTASDLSEPMLDQARRRLDRLTNIDFALMDGQALTFPDESFDAVLCGMALMLFPDAGRGLSQFYRVLRSGRWAAVSVNTVPERSFVTRINDAIGRHVPSRARAAAQYFSLGDASHITGLFKAAGFLEVTAAKKSWHYGFPSFDAYFERYDTGRDLGATGTEYVALPDDVRRAVREDVRRGLEREKGGPIVVEVEILFVSGQK
jgi:ubiquinone/menaquinone biosynthesis C-methylase UbiE